MWSMLKYKPLNGQTYEQIRKVITTPQFRKLPTPGKVVEKFVVDTMSKQLNDNDFARKSLRNLTQIEKENRILKTHGVLQRTRFTWKGSPIKVLREKLWVVGLQLNVFEEDSILFNKLKHRLGRKFQVGEFHIYHTFIELINQNDFQWQIYTIWEVLVNIRPAEGCYGILESLLQT